MSLNFVIPEMNIGGNGNEVPTLQFWKKGFRIGSGKVTPDWRDVILSGNTALTLVNAKKDSLTALTLFGGTEQLPSTYLDTITLSGACEQRNLPSGYTQVEYIESDGTAWLDTGFIANGGMVFDGKVMPVDGDNMTIGSITDTGEPRQADLTRNLITYVTGNNAYTPQKLNNYQYTYTDAGTSPAVIHLDTTGTKFYCTVNGNVVVNTTTGTLTGQTTTVKIGLSDYSQTIRKGRYYPLQFRNSNGDLVRDLVPAKNSSNVVSMYDLVSNTFLPVQGTGTFTAGADVTTPSPDYPVDIVCNNGVIKAKHQSGLPLEYTQVEYVTNTGQTLLDTGVKFDFSKNYEIELRVRGVEGSWYILQAREVAGGSINGLSGSQTGNKISLSFNENNISTSQIIRETGHIYYLKSTINNGNLTLYVKDETVGTEETVTGTYTVTTGQSVNIGLFGNLAGNYVNTNSDVYFARIKEDDTYILNYVPCKQSTKAGFYDKVSGTFKTTTKLAAGNPVSDPVEIYTDGTQEVVTDSLGNTANAERLLAIGDYKDTQEVLNGSVARNIGVLVLDGTEDWNRTSTGRFYNSVSDMRSGLSDTDTLKCSHFKQGEKNAPLEGEISFRLNFNGFILVWDTNATVEQFKQWLTTQYAQGTPVIVVYPTSSATTETVTGQFLSKSPVTQTAGSISNLPVAITESEKTVPTPTQPLPINCNNGVVKVRNKSGLPLGYQAVEYLENTSTNIGDCYINTGIYDVDKVIVKTRLNTFETYSYVFGNYISEDGDRVVRLLTQDKAGKLYATINSVPNSALAYDGLKIGEIHEYTLHNIGNSQSLYIDGVQVTNRSISSTGAINTTPIVLFANRIDSPTRGYVGDIYYFKAYKNNVLVCNLIPARRNSDNVLGMYDLVNNTFLTNAGSGTFTAGADIDDMEIYVDGTTETVEITGKNLFNNATKTDGVVLTDGGEENPYPDGSVSCYIKVKPNTTYTLSFIRTALKIYTRVCTYSANKTFIDLKVKSTDTSAGNQTHTFTTDSNAEYIRFCFKTNSTNVQLEQGSTATSYEPYTVLGTATAENLFKVGTYQDVQSVIDGGVIRNVGVKVLDGSENVTTDTYGGYRRFVVQDSIGSYSETQEVVCSHYIHRPAGLREQPNSIYLASSGKLAIYISADQTFTTVAEFSTWLASQYNAGTPVTILYPLATPTTETVTAQPMNIQAGTNIVQITQASMDDLELEVKYKAGVSVTITEVQNAQLDDNVEVIING